MRSGHEHVRRVTAPIALARPPGRVARRRETRSDKLFDSSNAGPHSTFSRGRAAFRCVRVILKVSVPDLDDSSFAPLFCTTPSAASHAPYPRSPVATRRPRCKLFPEWPQWSACCLLDLSHSCPVSTPHAHHSSPTCNRVLTRTVHRYHRDFKPLMAHTLSRALRNEAPIGGQTHSTRSDKVRQLLVPTD